MSFDITLNTRWQNFDVREAPRDGLYLASYSVFLRFFKERIAVKDIDENDAKTSVILIYSWMGRAILKASFLENFSSAKTAITVAKSRTVTPQELETISLFVGGSLIATSKFLHFLNPELYAIWDRNVAWAGYRFRNYVQYNNTRRYLEYLADLKTLTVPKSIHDRVARILGDVSEIRAKEFALFHLGICDPPPKT